MGKRLVDVLLALAALGALSIVFVALAAAIYLTMGRPILFRQRRPGLQGRPFCMYKFRTMTDGRDEHGKLLSDVERTTWLGKFLRSTSLDELPELWNVVRGDMSLVGPRPLLMDYLPFYTAEQALRHEVRPGLTGLAQVKGRNALTWEQKFYYDRWYVEHQSAWLDVKILWATVLVVFMRKGINHSAVRPMPRFDEYARLSKDRGRSAQEGSDRKAA